MLSGDFSGFKGEQGILTYYVLWLVYPGARYRKKKTSLLRNVGLTIYLQLSENFRNGFLPSSKEFWYSTN